MKSYLKKTIWPSGSRPKIVNKYKTKKYWDRACRKYKIENKMKFESNVWYCCKNDYMLMRRVCLNRVVTGQCPIMIVKKCHFFNQWRLAMGDELEKEIMNILDDVVSGRVAEEQKVIITPTLSASKKELDKEEQAEPVVKMDTNKMASRKDGLMNLADFVRLHIDKPVPELCKMAIYAIRNGQVKQVPSQFDLKKFKSVIKKYLNTARRERAKKDLLQSKV